MIEPLPKWLMRAYSKLWERYKDKEFNREEASKTLDNEKMIGVILSGMKKAGWLEPKFDPKDSRRHFYKLIEHGKAIAEMAKT